MDTNELKQTLIKLHANLETTENLDPELKEILQVLDKDIQALLDKDDADDSISGELVDRSQAISAKFAAEHPQLEPILRELGQILQRMGI
ncbi:DUF4404 family protein [Herminiimonas sp. CN]|uniref:DUF4404 family protein n=1 Tax=Herminiimonas sp. CN TaxID=1349818 RepID=UPI000473C959|nr:DUF4404 family protein [Herminiimonas sp. CN]